ncbi:MAG: PAS domain S-box protein [Bacteroidetes bacterium]|jgi:PAS domain S-box-containing protein|nr:PAS domain S-box protein [Bacteroidota bacterium]
MEFRTRNEQARLAALRRYAVMDTPPEEAFDRLVQMASRTLEAPAALMTLLDADRQWFKASVGWDAEETPREFAICEHNLMDTDVLVVPDLTADARFADNPYVAGDPGLRFYAGAPLCTPDGFILGSICVLDTAPRTLTSAEVATLEDLAALAVEELERRAVHSYRQGLLESITDAFVAVDTNWRCLYVNARAEELLQRDRTALLGRSLWDEFAPETVPKHYRLLHEAAATQEPVRYEAYVAPLDRWMNVGAYPFDRGLSIYFADITERKEVEQALRQREDDLREAHRVARLGSWTWDLQADVTTWSVVKYDIFGLPPEKEVTYETFISHVHPEDRANVRTFGAGIRGPEGPDSGEIDYRIIRPDGEVCFIRERSELIRAPDGTPLRMVGTAQDVTAETQRTAELIQAKEEADQMNRLKSRFLANMSHEIRTPLTSIIGFAEVLKEMELEGPVAECADTIYRSSDRLFTTLTSVLDLSQLEAGTLTLHPEELVVQDLVTDVVSTHDRHAVQQGIALECTVPPFDVEARVDRSACIRVLSNIIGNAVKFTPEGAVDVRLQATADTFTCTISDTGIGIAESFLPSLFDPFKQESNGDTRLYEGSGLGLAITKDLVDLMGGTIHVETQKGEGTTVTVRLPRVLEV